MPATDQQQIVPPTREEVWRLVDAAEELGGCGRDMVFLDTFTGLRRNEILALEFLDIDWTNKEIVINKAVSKTKTSGGVRKWNGGSALRSRENRTVGLPPRTPSWNCCAASVPRQRTVPG